MKEQLVSQLKTQIIDLERFIIFLQGNDNVNSFPRLLRLIACNVPVSVITLLRVSIRKPSLGLRRCNPAGEEHRRDGDGALLWAGYCYGC